MNKKELIEAIKAKADSARKEMNHYYLFEPKMARDCQMQFYAYMDVLVLCEKLEEDTEDDSISR